MTLTGEVTKAQAANITLTSEKAAETGRADAAEGVVQDVRDVVDPDKGQG